MFSKKKLIKLYKGEVKKSFLVFFVDAVHITQMNNHVIYVDGCKMEFDPNISVGISDV
jgi:hypothetical protein